MTIREICLRGREAIPALQASSGQQRNDALLAMERLLLRDVDTILEANQKDLAHASENGVPTQEPWQQHTSLRNCKGYHLHEDRYG